MNILILGGTTESSDLASRLAADRLLRVATSVTGRRKRSRAGGIVRLGGFATAERLATYLAAEAIDLLIDATPPFARRTSFAAAEAAAATGTPRLMVVREPWQPHAEDRWERVETTAAAAALLGGRPGHRRVFLDAGKPHLDAFAELPEDWFLVRLVDTPTGVLPLRNSAVITGRGPFGAEAEASLLRDYRVEAVVSKNSGGRASYGKIAAARALGLPVIMIDRPTLPPGEGVRTVDEAMAWIDGRRRAAA